jgi:hypothetical protein
MTAGPTRSGFLGRLRGALSDMNNRTKDIQFEARLDQSIHEIQEQVRLAEEDRRAAMASAITLKRQLALLSPQLADMESRATAFLAARRPGKARALSDKIVTLAADIRECEVRYAFARQRIAENDTIIALHQGSVARLKRQMGLRRAAVSLQRSQEAITRYGESSAVAPTAAQQARTTAVPIETADQVMARLSIRAKAAAPPTKSRGKPTKRQISSTTRTKAAKATTKKDKGTQS